jgi:hypothetical protein
MKKVLLLVLFVIILFTLSARAGSTCDVLGLYSVLQESTYSEPVYGLNQYGLLSPTQMALAIFNPQPGTFRVTVKRVSTNVYRSVSPDFIIQTRGCFELASFATSTILDYKGGFGQPSLFPRGSLIFP